MRINSIFIVSLILFSTLIISNVYASICKSPWECCECVSDFYKKCYECSNTQCTKTVYRPYGSDLIRDSKCQGKVNQNSTTSSSSTTTTTTTIDDNSGSADSVTVCANGRSPSGSGGIFLGMIINSKTYYSQHQDWFGGGWKTKCRSWDKNPATGQAWISSDVSSVKGAYRTIAGEMIVQNVYVDNVGIPEISPTTSCDGFSNCDQGNCPSGQKCYNNVCVDPNDNNENAQWICENCFGDSEIVYYFGQDDARSHKLSKPEMGFESGTTQYCCNRYINSNEWGFYRYNPETGLAYLDPPLSTDYNDVMCCNNNNDCVWNSKCYTTWDSIDYDGDGRKDSICSGFNWLDCDYELIDWTNCGYPSSQWAVGSGDANADGGFSLTHGCGDDAGEWYKCNPSDSSDCACCDSDNDNVVNGICSSLNSDSTRTTTTQIPVSKNTVDIQTPTQKRNFNIFSWIRNIFKIIL